MSKSILIILFQIISVFISFPETIAQEKNRLMLSEIMFCPESGNNEFVEIYNSDTAQSIDLKGFGIGYHSSNTDLITDAGYGTILPPEGYAVLLEGDYDIEGGIYSSLIPSSALIVRISDNSFGSSGMSNSAGRTVRLLNSFGEIIDSCMYTADNPQNISEEKIFLDQEGGTDNWKNSTEIYGTPGFRNSVTPYDYDLKIEYIHAVPSRISRGKVLKVELNIFNGGLYDAGEFKLSVFDDKNKDSAATQNEMISEKNYTGLKCNDSVKYEFNYTAEYPGNRNIIGIINYLNDENPGNNIKYTTVDIYLPEHKFNDIAVNEIMYAPSNGEPEWIELFNCSDKKINLKGWTVSDNSSKTVLTDGDLIIDTASFLVAVKDSSFKEFYSINNFIICGGLPSLNNTGDKIIVSDSMGTLIDSIEYSPEWGGKKGKSLERKDPAGSSNDSLNWGTSHSIGGGTPGSINSISKKDFDVELTGVYAFPDKPLYGEDVNLSATVKNRGKYTAVFTLDLFEDLEVDSVYEKHVPAGGPFTIGAGDSMMFPVNYIIQDINSKRLILIKAVYYEDQDTTNNSLSLLIKPGYVPHTVLINEVMANPSGGEPEWIEFVNTSSFKINMSEWTISDVLTTPYKIKLPENVFLPADSYLIVTSDSSVSAYHKNIPCRIITVNLPLLNNDEDGVVLKDDRNVIIDSMFYNKSYGLIKGYSLERRSKISPSAEFYNWAVSEDPEQSTPGRINSKAKKLHDLSLNKIFTGPQFPAEGEEINIKAEVMNAGESGEQDFSIEFYYKYENESGGYIPAEEVNGKFIAPGDSAIYSSPSSIKNVKDGLIIYANIICPEDGDTLNNRDTIFVRTGYPEGIVKINEIMYGPSKNMPEWFELINTSNSVSINLKDWSVSEILPSLKKVGITDNSEYWGPGEYLIITEDKAFPDIYPGSRGKLKILNFGTLGNTSDGLVVYDPLGTAVDSVFYSSRWGGGGGRSLERIALSKGSNDSTNWRSSLSPEKGTPGYGNSVADLLTYNKQSVVINEIMYEPAGGKGEYVELMNISEGPVNLAGWFIGDAEEKGDEITGENTVLVPGEYFVLASDSVILDNFELGGNTSKRISIQKSLSLSNSGQSILLKDALGKLIDSVFFLPGWHNKNFASTKNISLEKINPYLNGNAGSNWSSSVDGKGGTPCKQNSIFTVNNNPVSDLSVSPNPFSPDNDGFEDFTIIKYRLRNVTANIRIRIFNSRGYLVRTLANSIPSGQDGSIVFDGLDDNNNPLRIGIYIILLEAFNQNSGMLENMKKVVVVARKLN